MKKFGHEWMMFYVAHKAKGNTVEDSENWADDSLYEIARLRIPLESVWVANQQDLSRRLVRILVQRHTMDGQVEVKSENDGSKWFETWATLLDESRWIRVAK